MPHLLHYLCLLILPLSLTAAGGEEEVVVQAPPPPPIPELEQRIYELAQERPAGHSSGFAPQSASSSDEDDDKPSKVPMERPDLFEGDITNVDPKTRNAIRNEAKLWKNGVVPYVISSYFSSSEKAVIRSAVEHYRSNTCIRFVPRSNQGDYVYFRKRRGCSSDVGRNGGSQVISLGSGCVHKGVVVHEMMHAIGFWHEQSRADRDNYVSVHWGNIYPGLEYNFQKYTLQYIQHLGEAYDYTSIMHYDRTSFSKDGRSPTITPKQSGVQIGQRRGLSTVDIRKINKLYKCSNTGGGGVATTVAPPTCSDKAASFCAHWQRQGYCTSTYVAYMRLNCQKTCGFCDGDNGGQGQCTDSHQTCAAWASMNQCQYNPAYMLKMCRKSCNSCGGTSTTCTNLTSHRSCQYWAGIGECTRNPNYMKVYCKKSCSAC